VCSPCYRHFQNTLLRARGSLRTQEVGNMWLSLCIFSIIRGRGRPECLPQGRTPRFAPTF
jgi:hypothetical protein